MGDIGNIEISGYYERNNYNNRDNDIAGVGVRFEGNSDVSLSTGVSIGRVLNNAEEDQSWHSLQMKADIGASVWTGDTFAFTGGAEVSALNVNGAPYQLGNRTIDHENCNDTTIDYLGKGGFKWNAVPGTLQINGSGIAGVSQNSAVSDAKVEFGDIHLPANREFTYGAEGSLRFNMGNHMSLTGKAQWLHGADSGQNRTAFSALFGINF